MQFLPLLGKQLKDDEVIDFLALLDADVIYDFDRLHEGRQDVYRAASKEDGIELRFDATQRLDTIILCIMPHDGFGAFLPSDCDVPLLETPSEAESFGAAQRLHVSKGQADFLAPNQNWVRLGFGAYSIRYEFRRDTLALVTVSQNAG